MTNREKIRNITKKEGKEVLKNKLADLKKEDKTNEEIVKYFEKEYNLIYKGDKKYHSLKMSINFIYREQNGKANTKKEPVNEIQELKKEYYSSKEKSEHKKHIKDLIIENEKLQVQNDFIGDLKQQIKNKSKIEKIAITNKKNNKEIIPVLVLSDWHIEENVDPNTVSQLNDYNLNIAKKRSEKLIKNVLKMLKKVLNGEKCTTMIIALLGDFISGYIHEELMENNELSPTQAIIEVKIMLSKCINYLLDNTKLNFIIPCSYGNHGRTGLNKKIATGYKNSYEWLMYQFLEEEFKNNKRVTFQISNGYFNYVKIKGYNLRFHHGDSIRGGGGIAGITAPINNSIRRWNMGIKADYDIFGHFHQNINHKNFVCNGSLIGATPYGMNFGHEEPVQVLFFLNEKYGKNIYIPIAVK